MNLIGLKQLLERSDASGSKSTILQPLNLILFSLLSALIILTSAKAESWILVSILAAICVTFIVYFYAYIFCLHKNPDSLRSEKFTIQKLVVEKGYMGDNISGLFEPEVIQEDNPSNTLLLNQSEEER